MEEYYYTNIEDLMKLLHEIQEDIKDIRKGLNNLSEEVVELKHKK